MKRNYILGSLLALSLTFTACDDYLDKMPDNRATIDSEQKITSLLVSAYPKTNYATIAELYSDNVDKIGYSTYTAYTKLQEEAALWEDITDKDADSPYELWNGCYMAIASANQALKAIEELGNPESLKGEKGEALMCRAYAHWVLCNIFCLNYSPKTSTTDLGVPYVTEVENTVSSSFPRGTVAEDYEKMEKDIQEALPLMDDSHLSVPKYHFNKKAAYAFASRFYLFYVKEDKSNYNKVIEYATEVLTSNPANTIRDWATIGHKAINNNVRSMAYTDASDPANLLLYTTYSLWDRIYGPYGVGYKYCHNNNIASYESCAPTPWGNKNYFNFNIPQYQGMPKIIMAKMAEYFEYTDPVNSVGNPWIIYPALTTDEVLINRAEAYAMTGQYSLATADLNVWGNKFYSVSKNVTEEEIANFYGDMEYYTPTEPTPKKKLNPDFTVEEGEQESFIHSILHIRRILFLHEGKRLFDIKRYGIEICRRDLANGSEIIDELKIDDPRRAVQLPQSVMSAGMEPNPRKK